MSGWSMLNLELIDDKERRRVFRDRHDEFVDVAVQKKAHKEGHRGQGFISSARYHGTVVIRISGYREWEQDLRFARQLHPDLWVRAVIVQANDTGDVGEARLYESASGKLEQADSFVEDEIDDGRTAGDKAAAVMFARHGVPCLGNFQHPYEFTRQTGEWDEEKETA